MDKAPRLESKPDTSLDEQRRGWSEWNATGREKVLGESPLRQAQVVEQWLARLPRGRIIDIGCGAGWMCERLAKFGQVTGTDLADEVVQRARARLPGVEFIAGDFMALDFPAPYDIAVTLEVLSAVVDQPAFVARVARLLRPGGYLALSTPNRPVLDRMSYARPVPGTIRHHVDARILRQLLAPHFEVLELISVLPGGDQGFLRIVNSYKLNHVLGLVIASRWIERTKERLMLGQSLLVLARKR